MHTDVLNHGLVAPFPGAWRRIAAVVRRAMGGVAAALVLVVAGAGDVRAAGTLVTWTGGAGTGNWSTATNWTADPSGLGAAFSPSFSGTVQLTSTNSTFSALTRISFLAGAGAFTLNGVGTGTTVALTDRIDNLSTSLQTINFNLSYAAVERIDAVAGGTNLINGSISGAGGLEINGAGTGTTILTGSNSYAGLTTVTAGVLNIRNGNALGTTAAATTVASGAALELQGGITVGEALNTLVGTGISSGGALRSVSGTNTWSGLISLGGATRINSDAGSLLILDVASGNAIAGSADNLTFGGSGNITVADPISNTTATLTKDGAGALTLAAANVYSGATTVSAGVLRATTNAGALGSGGLTLGGGNLELANDSGVNFGRNTTVSTSGTIFSERLTGGAGVTHTLGTLAIGGQTLSVATDASVTSGTAGLTFSGAVSVSGGSPTFIVNPGASAATRLTLGAVTATNLGIAVGGGGDTSITGIVGLGTGPVTKTGTGTLTLSAANTYTGTTGIREGTLSIGALNNLGTATSAVVLGDGSNQGRLSYTGTSVSYTRGLTVAAGGGRLDVTQSGSTFTIATGNVTGSGLFTVGGAGNVTVSSTISGVSGLTMAGSGTLTLSGTNTFGGTTTVNSGVLRLGASNVLSGSNSVNVAGGTLDLGTSSNALAGVTLTSGSIVGTGTLTSATNYTTSSGSIGIVLGGTGGLVQSGNGLTLLSASNSYSGTSSIRSGTVSVGTVLAGAVSQPLGTAGAVNLGVSGTSSGRLLYTGGSGTLSKNVFALGNGTDTIQNSGTGLLTLSGTLTKNGTILRLQGGTAGITVTGLVVGSSSNSDLAVQSGLATLSATNTYVGPTFVNTSGTLALGISNAIPSNSAVTIGGTFAGGDGGPGVLSMGSFTNQIGSLSFSGSGGRIAMVPTTSATSAAVLAATGGVNLDGSSALDLTGLVTSTSVGLYRLIGGGSLTGTFATVSGTTDPNYVLRYGTAEVGLQRKADQATTFTLVTSNTRALVNTNVALSGTITNTSPVLSTALSLGLSSTGQLAVSGFTTGSVPATGSSPVSGTIATGTTVGSRTWTVLNTDAGAITTTSTATGSLTVVAERSYSPSTIGFGRFLNTTGPLTGTATITSSGLTGTTASGTVGGFAASNGLTLSLAAGVNVFTGTAATQSGTYTTTGGGYSGGLGAISGSFAATATNEFGGTQPVAVAYSGTAVAQRTFSQSTSTLALGFVHQGGAFGTPTLVVTSTGLNVVTESGTLGGFTGGAAGFQLNPTSGTNVFDGGASPQTATYTLSGSTGALGAISGTYSSLVTREFSGTTGIAVAVTGQVYSGQSTWTRTTSGTHFWGTFSGTGADAFGLNWGTNQGSPGLDAGFTTTDTATFADALAGGTAVILLNAAAPSLTTITFNNAAGTYDLDVGNGGTGRITLRGSGTNGVIDVLAGSHEIHTELQLGSNLTVAVAASSGLTIHGDIAGSTYGVTKSGAGLLTLRGNNFYSGGTLVTGGTLSLGNSGTPLGSGTVVLSNGATLNMQGFTVANTIDSTNGVLLNPGAATFNISGTTTVSGSGATTGVYTVLSGGVGTFTGALGNPASSAGGTVTVNSGGVVMTTGTVTTFGSVIVNSGGQATLSGPVDGSVTSSGSTTFAGALGTLGTVLVNGGITTFQGTTLGDVNVGTSGTSGVGKRAVFAGLIAKTAHAYASGTIDILGSVAASGDVKAETGGVVRVFGSGTFGQAAMTNNGLFVVDRTANLALATSFSGSGSLLKLGPSVLTLTGMSSLSGQTDVAAGKLVVDGGLGAGGVSVAAGAALAGSGVIAGPLGGGGLIEPGNSPGILTAARLVTTGTASFAFEFTGTGSPVWSSGTASGNDVLRLTDGAAPFAAALTATNLVNVYLDVPSITGRSTFTGGFFTDKDADFQILVDSATYVVYVRGDGGGTATTYNGQGYYALANWGPTNIYDYQGMIRKTTQVASANFATGTVNNGWVTEFIVVPEPPTLVLCGCGLIAWCGCRMRRRRRN